MKGVRQMLDFTWKVFSQTGNVEMYLLLKEIEEQDFVHITVPNLMDEKEEATDPFV